MWSASQLKSFLDVAADTARQARACACARATNSLSSFRKPCYFSHKIFSCLVFCGIILGWEGTMRWFLACPLWSCWQRLWTSWCQPRLQSSVVFVTFLCPFDVGITRPRLAVVFIWGSSALQRQWHHTNTNKERRWNHKQEFMFAKYDPLKDSWYGNDFMPQETYCKLFGFLANCRNRILILWHEVNRESNTSYICNKKII